MKDGCLNVCKYLVFFFNFLFFLGGGFLLGLGVYGLAAKDNLANLLPEDVPMRSVIIVLIFVGSVVFVAGFLGCCGAIRESRCLLVTFFVVVLIIFIVEVVSVILMYVYYGKVEGLIVKEMNTKPETFDSLQKEAKCCGFNGPNDYNTTPGPPASCYPNNTKLSGSTFTTGCKASLFKYFWYIAGVGLGILFIELIAMVSAISLCRGVDDYETA